MAKDPNSVQQRERQPGPLGGGRPVQASGGRSGRWREGPERVSPDAARQAARERVAKLQQALVVLGETSGPEVDGLRSALAKAQKSASEPTLEVQVTECKSFIARAEKRVAALDVQRAQEMASLEEGRARLIRLESAVLEAPQVVMPPPEASSEVLQLRELVSQLQAQIRGPDHQDVPCMPIAKRPCRSGQGSGPVPVMPRYIPAELSAWMGERQADLHDALADGGQCSSPRDHFQAVRRGGAHGGDHRRDDAVRTRVINARYGLRGVRVGEASHPGPASKRRRTHRLRALQRSIDSDGESSSDMGMPIPTPS